MNNELLTIANNKGYVIKKIKKDDLYLIDFYFSRRIVQEDEGWVTQET